MSKLLIDSSFIIALFRKNDGLHQKAIENKDMLNNDCYITDGILAEVMTIIGQKTKDIGLVRTVYNYLKDNFTIIHESEISMYNDNVLSVFEKYNQNSFKVSFIDCSQVIIYNHYNLDYVISLDNGFGLFEEIELKNLSEQKRTIQFIKYNI
ncbi:MULTISPECIES: PIN domain-containing protein [Methanobrevibacter]|uniref:Putative nucleic acid-binding protein n=1 Tax=Methanobrevibacter gottschalkii DSM 11977 TaxID=1122229 RepID=A0A3N5C5X0_9EURY|nr:MULTISPECIES: PIN domain-containing protein [Methanobrevibacter]OEC98032.1 hypothetical protein A9505_04945 [Methanobrevibacter sp. A27]RPF51771.1 putative nucleic acid-binding protein [Methanobrevibacter gottschalkii DSM 11977]